MYNKRDENTPGEWQTDEYGRRYRKIGACLEFEPTIRIDGIEVPQSELEDYNARKKAAEEERRKKEMEAIRNAPPMRSCPFSNGCDTSCRRDACTIFIDGKCSIAAIADAVCVGIEETPAKGKRCPFSVYGNCGTCALFNHGCAIARIATAQNKNN